MTWRFRLDMSLVHWLTSCMSSHHHVSVRPGPCQTSEQYIMADLSHIWVGACVTMEGAIYLPLLRLTFPSDISQCHLVVYLRKQCSHGQHPRPHHHQPSFRRQRLLTGHPYRLRNALLSRPGHPTSQDSGR